MNKTACAAALASLFILALTACQKQASPQAVYTGTGEGFRGPIEAEITVADGKITAARVLSHSDTEAIAGPAIEAITAQAASSGSADNLDSVSGASFTSQGLIQALQAAWAASQGKGAAAAAPSYTDTETDIVVIRAGGAGLAAAAEAASLGKRVIVVEKMPIVGGNTNYATGGLNASETSVQKSLNISDSNQSYYDDTMKGGRELNDPALVRTLVENSAATVDWLIGLGADLSDVGKMAGSTNSRTHRPKGGAAVGPHLVQVLDKAARASGADIRLNNKALSILNEDGRAAGVTVSANGKEYIIRAKAVIVASGGFGANPQIIESYRPELQGFGTTNHAGATGDALAMVEPFNAALVDMDQIQTHPTVVPVQNLMITEAVRGNGAIMVNREGRRFNSEMATRDIMSEAILRQTGKTAFLVFDQGVRDSLKAIEDYARQGLLVEGSSLAELAQRLSIPADALEATVAQYNEYQAAGVDSEFGRAGSEMPRPIATAPFYAVEVGPAVHHTMGGIKIDTAAEVLNTSGEVIPGLYAAGEVTGGVHGANRLGGNAVADITVFGKIAGDSASAYIDSL